MQFKKSNKILHMLASLVFGSLLYFEKKIITNLKFRLIISLQEKDRDGCPKIVNLGTSKTDLFYERKKYGFKKR